MATFTYWITFRLGDSGSAKTTYQRRYEKLMAALRILVGNHISWDEPSSFIVFECDSSLATVAAGLSLVLEMKHDLLVVSSIDNKSGYIWGAIDDDDIFKLMPHLVLMAI